MVIRSCSDCQNVLQATLTVVVLQNEVTEIYCCKSQKLMSEILVLAWCKSYYCNCCSSKSTGYRGWRRAQQVKRQAWSGQEELFQQAVNTSGQEMARKRGSWSWRPVDYWFCVSNCRPNRVMGRLQEIASPSFSRLFLWSAVTGPATSSVIQSSWSPWTW